VICLVRREGVRKVRNISLSCALVLYICFPVIAFAAQNGETEPMASESVAAEDSTSKADEKKKPKDPAEIFVEARIAMGRQDVKNAVILLRKAAWRNYIPAQVMLGEYLDVSEFDQEAVGWFLTAAYQGNPEGAFYLGKMYASGEGIEKSEEKGYFWIRFAAERNHLSAVKVLASTYRDGLLGQAKDAEQAKFWLDKIPALQEADRKESIRQRQLARKKMKDAESEDKKYLEKLRQDYLESNANANEGESN